jgi:hypothetical protein
MFQRVEPTKSHQFCDGQIFVSRRARKKMEEERERVHFPGLWEKFLHSMGSEVSHSHYPRVSSSVHWCEMPTLSAMKDAYISQALEQMRQMAQNSSKCSFCIWEGIQKSEMTSKFRSCIFLFLALHVLVDTDFLIGQDLKKNQWDRLASTLHFQTCRRAGKKKELPNSRLSAILRYSRSIFKMRKTQRKSKKRKFAVSNVPRIAVC